MGAELIGWTRESQAARPERQGADQARPGHGAAHLGRRRHAGQAGHLHHQPRRLGRAEDPRPRTSAPAPGPSWRSSPPRCSGSKVTDIKSNIGNSTFPPGQASGGSTTTPSMSPPDLRRGQPGARRLLQEDRPRASTPTPERPLAQGRQGPGQGRAEADLEGRLPQARHDADLRDRQVRAGPVVDRRRRLPVRRRDGGHRDGRRPGQEDRRDPGLGPDHRQADLGEPGLRRA